MTRPRVHKIEPENPKTKSAAAFVPRFTIFAVDEAARNEYPNKLTRAMRRNDPVPGPKIPS
jgi:hypothetical protein